MSIVSYANEVYDIITHIRTRTTWKLRTAKVTTRITIKMHKLVILFY